MVDSGLGRLSEVVDHLLQVLRCALTTCGFMWSGASVLRSCVASTRCCSFRHFDVEAVYQFSMI